MKGAKSYGADEFIRAVFGCTEGPMGAIVKP